MNKFQLLYITTNALGKKNFDVIMFRYEAVTVEGATVTSLRTHRIVVVLVCQTTGDEYHAYLGYL